MYSKENLRAMMTKETNDCSGCDACIVSVEQKGAWEVGGRSS